MTEVKRMDWLDMAKGYGIFLVMVAHLAEWTPVGSVIYSFHIPLFFLLSGYLFSIRDSFKAFAVKRVKGMLVPYFALSVPMILWDMFVEKGGLHWPYAPMIANGRIMSLDGYGGTFRWDNIRAQKPLDVLARDVLGLLIQKRMWTFWFLACLFVISFLFYLLVRFLKKEWVRLILVCMIAAAGFVYDFSGGGALPWNIDVAVTSLPFFYVGWLLKKYDLLNKWLFKNKGYRVRKWGVLIFTGAFLVNVAFCFLNWALTGEGLEIYYNQYGFLPVMYVSAFAGCFATIVLGGIYTLRPVKYIGGHSLIYFLLHQGIFLPLNQWILRRLGLFQGTEGAVFWLNVLLTVLLTLAEITLLDVFIRKTPLRAVVGK